MGETIKKVDQGGFNAFRQRTWKFQKTSGSSKMKTTKWKRRKKKKKKKLKKTKKKQSPKFVKIPREQDFDYFFIFMNLRGPIWMTSPS